MTWHADKFRDAFEVMAKRKGQEVLLTVDGGAEGGGGEGEAAAAASPRRRQPDNKVEWSPVKALNEVRRAKEAPPKNLVQERLRSFEKEEEEEDIRKKKMSTQSGASDAAFSMGDIEDALEEDDVFLVVKEDGGEEEGSEVKKDTRELIRKQRKKREEFFQEKEKATTTTTTDEEEGSSKEQATSSKERKRSVKELLSDFEKKSKEVHDEEQRKASLGMIGEDGEDLSGSRRRVFSDTETMNYGETSSSSDDVDLDGPPRESLAREDSCSTMIVNENGSGDEADGNGVDLVHLINDTLAEANSKKKREEDSAPELPPRSPKGSASTVKSYESFGTTKVKHPDDQYVLMTPPPVAPKTPTRPKTHSDGQYLHMTPAAAAADSSASSSQRSLSAAATKTPSEMLIQAVVHHHVRTPSENLVAEHLQKETLMTSKIMPAQPSPEEMYVINRADGGGALLLQQQQQQQQQRQQQQQQQQQQQRLKPILASVDKSPKRTVRLSAESPRYCEIDDSGTISHYEYLYKARSATPLHYESVNVYQEIPEEAAARMLVPNVGGAGAGSSSPAKPISTSTSATNTPTKKTKKERPVPLAGAAAAANMRPIEGLPDIIGNAPANRGASSSDPDEEAVPSPSSRQSKSSVAELSQISGSSFIPASFFLNQNPRRSSSQEFQQQQQQQQLLQDDSRRGSQSSISNRELPLTPAEVLRSSEDVSSPGSPFRIQQQFQQQQQQQPHSGDGSFRGSHSSLDSGAGSRRGGKSLHLPNIQEASQTMERRHQHQHFPMDEEGERMEEISIQSASSSSPSKSKVPYYVSDIVGGGSTATAAAASTAGGTMIEYEEDEELAAAMTGEGPGFRRRDTMERARAIDRLQHSMAHLDAETEEHLMRSPMAVAMDTDVRGEAGAMLERIRSAQQTPVAVHSAVVPRANSLDGLLGDNPGGPRDSVEVNLAQQQHLRLSGLVTPTLPARGRNPPPPPSDVPPLDLGGYDEKDDELWRQSLRRASARQQRARSVDPSEEHRILQQQQQQQHFISRSLAPSRNSAEPPLQQQQQQHQQSHVSGYVWDASEQRFYKLNDPGSPPNQKVMDPTFLGGGLPPTPGSSEQDPKASSRKKTKKNRAGRPDVAQVAAREVDASEDSAAEATTSFDNSRRGGGRKQEDFVIVVPPTPPSALEQVGMGGGKIIHNDDFR